MAQKPRRGGSIDDIDDPWALPKRDLGSWNLANPTNWAISVHSDAWFLHFNRSVLSIKVQQEEEEIRKKDDFHRVFMNRRDSPPDERRVFHYQNVWFPDTFINYWVIIASLNHFDPQISFRLCQNPSNSSLSGWVRFGLVDSWIIFGAINRAIDSIARILPKFQNFIQLQPLS